MKRTWSVEATGIKLKRIKCVAMEGPNEEGQEQIDEIEKGPLLDTALVAAAQKVEHYEIAGAQAVFPSQRRQRCDHCQNLEGPALLSPSMACPV